LLVNDDSAGTCVDPLGVNTLAPISSSVRDTDPRAILRLRMPDCANLGTLEAALRDRPITLDAIRQAVTLASRGDAEGVVDRCRRHELDLQQALGNTNFRHRFWTELAVQRRFARSFGEGMDDNVLFGKWRVDASVTLLELDFDPATHARLAADQPLQVLRQGSSKGVLESRLSPLQAALLREFGESGVAMKVVHAVIDRVQTPNVTQRQLAILALKIVRGFIQGGQLLPVKANFAEAWLIRRKFRSLRRNLFPAIST
jgi:hypothetical protein